MKRPLLVTDPGLAKLDIVHNALDICRQQGLDVALFCDLRPNPVGRDVDAGVEHLRNGGHDGVIAMGGGSGLDVGKAVALMAKQRRPLWDFEDREDWWTRVDTDAMVPTVAVPTTAGTGSEVGRCSVIIDERVQTKKLIFHPKMMPGRVLLDPELTVGLPAHLTAAVGMDALSHNLEGYCVDSYHPLADGIAVEGTRLIAEALIHAVDDGTNIDARSSLLVASMMGATAFQKGLGAMHALAHPIGAIHHTHHGLTNAVLMPYVLVVNQHVLQEKMDRLARYLGHRNGGFDTILDWVIHLRERIGIPHTLAELGLDESHIDRLIPLALADPSASGNPVQLTASSVERLLVASIRGDLDLLRARSH